MPVFRLPLSSSGRFPSCFRVCVIIPAIMFGALALTGCAADAASARLPLAPPGSEKVDDVAFADWLTAFREDALKAGVTAATFDRSMRGLRPDDDVVKANESQPEFTKPVWEYLEGALSDT